MKTIADITKEMESLKLQMNLLKGIDHVNALLAKNLSFEYQHGEISLGEGESKLEFEIGGLNVRSNQFDHFNSMYKICFDIEHPESKEIKKAIKFLKDLSTRYRNDCPHLNSLFR